MNWKDKTRERCVFQVAGECRRFPTFSNVMKQKYVPSSSGALYYETRPNGFRPACAEYAESLDDTSEFVQLSE